MRQQLFVTSHFALFGKLRLVCTVFCLQDGSNSYTAHDVTAHFAFFWQVEISCKPETIFSIMTKVKVAKGIHKQMSNVFDILSRNLFTIWIEQKSKLIYRLLCTSLSISYIQVQKAFSSESKQQIVFQIKLNLFLTFANGYFCHFDFFYDIRNGFSSVSSPCLPAFSFLLHQVHHRRSHRHSAHIFVLLRTCPVTLC